MIRESFRQLVSPIQKYIRKHPDIFIVGFQKCGTTSLHNYLLQNEHIVSSETKGTKEIDHLAIKDDLGRFLYNFPLKNVEGHCLATSHRFTYNLGGLARIKRYFPDAKILVTMRNPVTRAYSHYKHNMRTGGEPLSFETYVDNEFKLIEQFNNINDIKEIFEKTYAPEWSYGMFVTKGLYVPYIEEIIKNDLNFYPVFIEDIQNDFKGEMEKIYQFLEIPVGDLQEPPRYNTGGYKSQPESAAVDRLKAFYKPYNERLFKLIGKKSKHW